MLKRFLLNVPDLMVLMIPAVLLSIGTIITFFKRSKSKKISLVSVWISLYILLFVCMSFVALPVIFSYCFVLPRYYTSVIPFVFLSIVLAIRKKTVGIYFFFDCDYFTVYS